MTGEPVGKRASGEGRDLRGPESLEGEGSQKSRLREGETTSKDKHRGKTDGWQ